MRWSYNEVMKCTFAMFGTYLTWSLYNEERGHEVHPYLRLGPSYT